MALEVRDPEDAALAVERFNAFHDGFIRELVLTSHDSFVDRHTHDTTGRLDLRLLFAHSNYDEGRPPFDQLVEVTFYDVRELAVSFSGRPTDWPIDRLDLSVADADRLAARLAQPRLIDGTRWERVEAMAFTFSRARFEEVESGG